MNHYWSVSEPVVVGALTNSGSLTDQYKLIFPSLAFPFLPPRREMPPCGGREGGGTPLPAYLLESSPCYDGGGVQITIGMGYKRVVVCGANPE